MRPARRLNIGDLMILVPAAALATLLLRRYMPGFRHQLASLPTVVSDPWGLWHAYAWLLGPGSCVVIPGMAAMLVVRLHRPRPQLVRLEPGFVACLAVMVTLVPGTAWSVTILHRPGFARPDGFEQLWGSATQWTGTAVAGAWLALGLSRQWRPRRSWVDRAGRVLGLYWIVLLLAFCALQWGEALRNVFPGAWAP